MMPADCTNKKQPATGDLILTEAGIPLIVLGTPRDIPTEADLGNPPRPARNPFRGVLVCLHPQGGTVIWQPEPGQGRPEMILPWRFPWVPIPPRPGPH